MLVLIGDCLFWTTELFPDVDRGCLFLAVGKTAVKAFKKSEMFSVITPGWFHSWVGCIQPKIQPNGISLGYWELSGLCWAGWVAKCLRNVLNPWAPDKELGLQKRRTRILGGTLLDLSQGSGLVWWGTLEISIRSPALGRASGFWVYFPVVFFFLGVIPDSRHLKNENVFCRIWEDGWSCIKRSCMKHSFFWYLSGLGTVLFFCLWGVNAEGSLCD